jgi:L-asparaginase II
MRIKFDFPAGAADPVLVEVIRGEMVESLHHGAIAIVDSRGGVVARVGDVDRPVFARSAIKPIQALPLVETGAAHRYGLGDKELALACASHHGEAAHTATVAAWLERIDLSDRDLECGAHLPYDTAAAHALIRAGEKPCPLHNNCSGKHSGFLTTARHLGEETRGYIGADHPVQRRATRALEEMTGLDLSRAPRGIDGCGIPVLGIPLTAMALAMARLADPSGLPDERRAAAKRLLDAMGREPLLVDGTGEFATEAMKAAPETVRVKPGAEGVFCAVLPTLGLGVALKVTDGAKRASEVAVGAVLERLGVLGETAREALRPFLRPVLKNVAGREIGTIRPAAGFGL